MAEDDLASQLDEILGTSKGAVPLEDAIEGVRQQAEKYLQLGLLPALQRAGWTYAEFEETQVRECIRRWSISSLPKGPGTFELVRVDFVFCNPEWKFIGGAHRLGESQAELLPSRWPIADQAWEEFIKAAARHIGRPR